MARNEQEKNAPKWNGMRRGKKITHENSFPVDRLNNIAEQTALASFILDWNVSILLISSFCIGDCNFNELSRRRTEQTFQNANRQVIERFIFIKVKINKKTFQFPHLLSIEKFNLKNKPEQQQKNANN